MGMSFGKILENFDFAYIIVLLFPSTSWDIGETDDEMAIVGNIGQN